MKHDSLHQQAIREITERLISTGNMDGTLENCPGMKERVARLIALLRSAMYPVDTGDETVQAWYGICGTEAEPQLLLGSL